MPDTVAGWRVTSGAAPGYVDDRACKECHESEYGSFAAVGMSRSFYPPDPTKVVEDLDREFVHQRTGFHYRMELRGGKFFLQRFCEDDEGRRFAFYEAEIAWIMGSGNHARAYLSQNARGELFQLPLAWYAEGGWGMAPGYDQPAHLRFERVIDRACMFCHNAYPEMPVGADMAHKEHLFPRDLPHGIGCQRCHGPGARHVEKANDAAATVEEIRARIFNSGNLPVEQRDQVCMACHLQPESQYGQFMPPSLDKPLYSHRPDQPITDYVTFLDHGSQAERRTRFEINHQAYRLRQSQCFLQSAGKLTCLTCHDPHRKVAVAARAAHYRSKCATCHQLSDCRADGMGSHIDPAQSDCVSCHMHRARPTDVVRVTMTDHLIQRSAPTSRTPAPLAEGVHRAGASGVVPYFSHQGRDPHFELYKGFGTAASPAATAAWRAAFEATGPHPLSAHVAVGRSLLERGDAAGALAVLLEGDRRFGDVAELQWSLGVVHHEGGRTELAIACLERARELDPQNPGINGSLGDAYARGGAWHKASVAYRRSLDVRANHARTWQLYGYALRRAGDDVNALGAFVQAIAQDPNDAYSYRQWAAILERGDDWQAMLRVLTQGATRRLGVEFDLVAALLASPLAPARSPARALPLARQLTRDHPDDPRAHLYLALAMVAVRPDPAEIERVLQTAQRLGADHASCAALLVLAQRRPGDHSALLGALLAAGGDHARRAIAELLQQSGLHRR